MQLPPSATPSPLQKKKKKVKEESFILGESKILSDFPFLPLILALSNDGRQFLYNR